jgi:chromosomal replication initiation ATPase DnaA
MTLARFAGDDHRRPRPTRERANAAIAAVGDHFGVGRPDLDGRSRLWKFLLPRQLAYLVLTEDLGLGNAAAGRLLGGRKRETVHDGLASIRRRLAHDPDLAADLAQIRRRQQLPVPPSPGGAGDAAAAGSTQ